MKLAPFAYLRGQNVVPVYEGWQRNGDGSFTMMFGYMNRNYEETLNIPVGPGNAVDVDIAAERGVRRVQERATMTRSRMGSSAS